MRTQNILLSAICAGVFLSACQSESGSAATTVTSIPEKKEVVVEGTVVDGYIRDASVCLEHNATRICRTSGSNGEYTFGMLEFDADTFVPVDATGGRDNATQREYEGSLYGLLDVKRYEEGDPLYITPLGDLAALAYLDTNDTYENVLHAIAQAYGIDETDVANDPMGANKLFGIIQDIEQTKALLFTLASHLASTSLTQEQTQAVRSDIRLAFARAVYENRSVDIQKVLYELEAIWERSIAVNFKTFVISQREIIRQALDSFLLRDNLTAANKEAYQNALHTRMDSILESFAALEEGEFLAPLAVEIDIFAQNDTNTTLPDDTNTTVPGDSNSTIPDDQDPVYILEGAVIDGYISGATVCIDINDDEVCGVEEPRTLSSSSGTFSFAKEGLEQGRYYRVMAFGGINTATQAVFSEQYFGIFDTSRTSQEIVLSPLSDLVARMFFRANTRDPYALSFAKTSIANALNLTAAQVVIDPLLETKPMLIAQEIETINKIFLKVVSQTLGASVTQVQKNFVKDALLEQYLESGYHGFDVARALIRIEVKLGIEIAPALRDFAIAQIAALKTKIAALLGTMTFDMKDYKRIEILLAELVTAIQGNTTVVHPVVLDYEDIVYSMFDKTGAQYDPDACLQSDRYPNKRTQSSGEVRFVDAQNGITLGFDATKITQENSFSLYYPDIGSVILQDDVDNQVKFESDYYFSYDSAWITTGKSIYLQAPINEAGKYPCLKIKLDQLYGIYLSPQPVYRYTSVP